MKYDSIDLASLAKRLIAARRAANVTQGAAATHLNMSRPTFIAIEKAARRPKPGELVKLSELYNEPLNKLLRGEAPPEQLQPHLRSGFDALSDNNSEIDAAISLLSSYIDDYQTLETMTGQRAQHNFPPIARIPLGSVDRFAEHCAQEERARLNLGSHQPICGLRNTLEEAGIHIFVEKLESSLAGLYVFAPAVGYFILVNRSHPRERRRWTIAHEYGHFLVDRDRPGVDYSVPVKRKSESERFADSFASAFLMPEAGVQRRFYEEVERSGDFKVADLCRMSDYFAVSLMAMALRLEALSLIPRGSWDQIAETRVPIRALKDAAGVTPSVEDDSLEPYPQRYKLLAVQAFLDEKITEGQLSGFLRRSRLEARDIVQQCQNPSNVGADFHSTHPLPLSRSLLGGNVKIA